MVAVLPEQIAIALALVPVKEGLAFTVTAPPWLAETQPVALLATVKLAGVIVPAVAPALKLMVSGDAVNAPLLTVVIPVPDILNRSGEPVDPVYAIL